MPAPAEPYFATLPLYGPPPLTAPRICQLCGDGFVSWKSLVSHCDKEHGGYNEYRKRLFWEGQRCSALGLPTVRKRSMIANATSAMLHARAGGDGDLEERREEACVVCARKGWLEHRYRCHLWKPFLEGDAEQLAEAGAEGGADIDKSVCFGNIAPETLKIKVSRQITCGNTSLSYFQLGCTWNC